ncbi:hypothetical protein JVT61DRAFT_6553 [Boletus reticuloceps]|uniref:C2 domain-containing protein n=1 Tax=Boletus reticuloceps TaxID=495285 RepID=A0A8I2YJC3_9AGAM|nr:hypothetical protein JVT61DRAFT_6553 [Boletus reticuloceps]
MSQPKEIGTLVVVVLKAQHLHQPSFYKQDPYAQATLSGQIKRTKVDPKGGQRPMWDDELRFPVLADAGKDRVNRILEISCYKDEQRGDDILLGKGTVDIEETLKTGEFDGMQLTSGANGLLQLTTTVSMSLDWVSLETSAGPRGEVYLEMTFYANSPPPLTRRPSKLNPSDRLARPAAYFTQGRQSAPSSTSPSPQPGRSPATGEKNPIQLPSTHVSQIPSSLIPAHGGQSQASRQAPSKGGAPSVVATKHKDSLPPIPVNDPPDSDSGKNLVLPAALQTGGRSGPRPMPPQSRNRATSTDRLPPELLAGQLHRRAYSDTPTLAPPSFSQSRTPMQPYPPEITSMTGTRVGSAPSIVIEGCADDHPPLAFPTPFLSPPGPTQVYMQPNSQGYISAPTQGFPHTFSPFQEPIPPQSPYTPPGRPQQLYNVSPGVTSPPSLHQQYTQYPSGAPTPQPLSPQQTYPQPYSIAQPQQQQAQYPPQSQQRPPILQQPGSPPQQQQYVLPHQQQQYQPQLPYTQTPHPPNISQLYQQHNHPGLPQSSQALVASPPPQSLYSQTPQQPQQTFFAVPPPPPLVQSQTPQPYTPQPTYQPQSHVSLPPPPPPPPPPPLSSQSGRGLSTVSVTQPSQTLVPSSTSSQGSISPPISLPQSATPAATSTQPPTIPLPSQVVPNTAPVSSTEDFAGQGKVEEGQNMVNAIAAAEAGTALMEEVRGTPQDVAKAERRRKAAEEEARRRRAEEEAERRWQEELARIRARAEQEAADAAFARAQMEAEEAERRGQEEADLALVRQAQEEAEREERLAQERRQQEEADREVARREQAHEEELERRRQEERRQRMEEADRELARKLDMELNLGT